MSRKARTLGPANDTPAVELEVWAAAFVVGDVEFGSCEEPFGPCRSCALVSGWHDDVDSEPDHDGYAAGALARAIFDHESAP